MHDRYLTILRHAKAEPFSDSGRDLERPLAGKGFKQLQRVGKLLKTTKQPPDWIVSSPAFRTRQTAEKIAAEIGYTKDIRWDERIYAAASSTLLTVLQDVPDNVRHVLLVGHNPGVAGLVSALCAGTEGRVNLRFPTAGIAHFEPQIMRWRQLRWGSCELRFLIAPRFLK